MRHLKFRAWDKDIKKMEFVGALDWDCNKKIVTCNTEENKHYMTEPEQFIIMQYTCLKDKNRKEIYEGDIVRRYSFPRDHNINQICVVVFKYGCFLFVPLNQEPDSLNHTYRDTVFYESELTVIGNIKENPELLEKRK